LDVEEKREGKNGWWIQRKVILVFSRFTLSDFNWINYNYYN
jgi:hypothetical protein